MRWRAKDSSTRQGYKEAGRKARWTIYEQSETEGVDSEKEASRKVPNSSASLDTKVRTTYSCRYPASFFYVEANH